MCSTMKMFEVVFIIAMLLPFVIRCNWAYHYWIAVTALYLAYVTAKRWEYE